MRPGLFFAGLAALLIPDAPRRLRTVPVTNNWSRKAALRVECVAGGTRAVGPRPWRTWRGCQSRAQRRAGRSA